MGSPPISQELNLPCTRTADCRPSDFPPHLLRFFEPYPELEYRLENKTFSALTVLMIEVHIDKRSLHYRSIGQRTLEVFQELSYRLRYCPAGQEGRSVASDLKLTFPYPGCPSHRIRVNGSDSGEYEERYLGTLRGKDPEGPGDTVVVEADSGLDVGVRCYILEEAILDQLLVLPI